MPVLVRKRVRCRQPSSARRLLVLTGCAAGRYSGRSLCLRGPRVPCLASALHAPRRMSTRITTDPVRNQTKATAVRTYSPKPGDIPREWHVIDATDVVLGRLAVQAATLLRGKHKPTYAPHLDTGDFVVIINADKVALSGTKRDTKMAYRHSGHPGGLSATSYGELLEK